MNFKTALPAKPKENAAQFQSYISSLSTNTEKEMHSLISILDLARNIISITHTCAPTLMAPPTGPGHAPPTPGLAPPPRSPVVQVGLQLAALHPLLAVGAEGAEHRQLVQKVAHQQAGGPALVQLQPLPVHWAEVLLAQEAAQAQEAVGVAAGRVRGPQQRLQADVAHQLVVHLVLVLVQVAFLPAVALPALLARLRPGEPRRGRGRSGLRHGRRVLGWRVRTSSRVPPRPARPPRVQRAPLSSDPYARVSRCPLETAKLVRSKSRTARFLGDIQYSPTVHRSSSWTFCEMRKKKMN